MTVTEDDLRLYAQRVRVYFPRELRDVAEELAWAIAQRAGPKTKALRPQTRLQEIWDWMAIERPGMPQDSLDEVEQVMSLEEEFCEALPDVLLGMSAQSTFLQLVQRVAAQRQPDR